MKLRAEFFKRTETDSVPNPAHQVKVKVEVMETHQRSGGHFLRHVEMAQVGARKVRAGVAAAPGIRWLPVLGIARVLDDEDAVPRQQLPVPRVSSRQHAIEHVDAARNALDEVV